MHGLATQQPLRKVDSHTLNIALLVSESREGKPDPGKHQARERKRCAWDSEKIHKADSKWIPKLVPTTEAGRLNRKQCIIEVWCEETSKGLKE